MRALFYGSLLCLAVTAHADSLDARAQVRAIGQLIEAHHYDATMGRSIAEELIEEASRGTFDRLEDPEELAVQLTSRLREVDRHFRVIWGQPPSGPRAPAKGDERAEVEHGVGRVERLSGNVAYMELREATHIDFKDAASPVRAKIDRILARFRDADAVILDLRANGGGSPAMVGYLVSAFVRSTDDIYNRFHTRDAVFTERPDVLYPQPLLDIPVFVLVGPGTASAAESLAYTLQSCGRGILVGERTAGAANPGAFFKTESGYSVFVPTGSPRNPLTQRNWEGEGVQPEVRVSVSDALARAHELAQRQ